MKRAGNRQTTSAFAGYVAIVVSVSALCAAVSAQRENIQKEEYAELVAKGDTKAIVQELVAAVDGIDGGSEFDAAGELLASSATTGAAVLDALSDQESMQAVTLRAELLVWMARGDEMPDWKRKERKEKPVLMTTDEVGRRAAALLGHDDPFVRGLAEWAIAIRVGMENGGKTSTWPREEVPAWYVQWKGSLTPEFILESDYVRQGVVLGVHRSSERLVASARKIADRARAVAASYEMDDVMAIDELRRRVGDVEAACDKLAQAGKTHPDDLTNLRRLWIDLRHKARVVVMTNPVLDFDQIVFATRHAYHDGPNITAGAKSYIIKPGGDILVKSGFDPGLPVRPLIAGQLPPGHMRGMELWWDADRLVFAYTKQPKYYDEPLVESDQGFDDKTHGASEPTHIYEVCTNGTGLRQITDHPFNSDVEPAYLPCGEIVFCSDRSNYGSQCSGNFKQNKKIVNLYRVAADGTNLRPLHNNKDFDRYPHVLDNGLVIYTRWEYQERHLWQTHNVWTTRPDGSMTDALYKEHINSGPMALRDPRQIPGSHKVVAIACGHHEYAQGAVTVVDHHIGVNETAGMRLVTPRISPREGGLGRGKTVEQEGVEDRGGLYQQPYALSETSFLVSYSYHLPRSEANANNFGVYYIDAWGNKELIHRDPVLSSVYPIPLKKRPVPPVIPDEVEPETNFALCYLSDVYAGLDGVEWGAVKYLRISHRTEQPTFHTGEKVTDFNHLHYVPDGSWAHVLGVWTWTPARVIGIVPVETDGSAYFKVPANVPLYFQALDANFMEIRRMRTFVSFQPGEVRGCSGCHETRNQTPARLPLMPMATRKPPTKPEPPSWGDRLLTDYERHIQPILTRHCASCHGSKEPAGGLEFTARKVDRYCQSYRTMFGLAPDDPTPVWAGYNYELLYPGSEPMVDKDALKKMAANQYPGQLVSLSDRFSDASITQPKEFGSHRSKLITALLKGVHKEQVHIPQDEWIALVTWVDLNAPYWGSFVDKEPLRDGGRPMRVYVEFPAPFDAKPGPCRIIERQPLSDDAAVGKVAVHEAAEG